MPFLKSGFRTLDYIGTVTTDVAGSNRQIHGYVTNDTAAAVETADYFLPVYERLKVGDLIFGSIDMDGTPAPAMYVVATASSAGVTISGSTISGA